jgi:hypothetical protein
MQKILVKEGEMEEEDKDEDEEEKEGKEGREADYTFKILPRS